MVARVRKTRVRRSKTKVNNNKPLTVLKTVKMTNIDDIREEASASSNENTCCICGNKIKKKLYGNVCGSACLDYSLDYNMISIPLPFVKSLYFKCPDVKERSKQLGEYAKRHGYDKEKVLRKARTIYEESLMPKRSA